MTSQKRRRAPSGTHQGNDQQTGSSSSTRAPENTKGPEQNTKDAAPFELDRVGNLLRRGRERRGENLYAIAEYLRIRPVFLAALENSRYDELPADAYVIGFLRSYASYLGFDGRTIIDHYRHEMVGRRRKPQLNMPQPISEGRAPTVAVLVGAGLAMVLIYALWYTFSAPDPKTTQVPPPQTIQAEMPLHTERQSPALAPSSTVAVSSSGIDLAAAAPAPSLLTSSKEPTLPSSPPQTPIPEPTDKPGTPSGISVPAAPSPTSDSPSLAATGSAATHLIIRAEKEAWVLVTDNKGNTLFDQILKPGETYNPPDKKGLVLTTGNGNGIVLNLDGTDLPRLTADSRLVRGVALDPDQLKTRLAAPAN